MRTKLKQFRIGEHLTQEEFAKKIGVSRAVYSNIERGRNEANYQFWQNLQTVFDLPDEEMWNLQKLDERAEQ